MGRRRGGGGGGGRGGRGGGRGGGGGDGDFEGGEGGGYQDQYGGFGSQDRDSFQPFSSKSGGGGGSAGGTAGSRSKPGSNISFQRQVPKFLQKYQHMLGGKGGQPDEDDPTMDDATMAALRPKRGYDDGEDEEDPRAGHGDDVELEALRRAMAENPELAKEFEGTLAKRLAQAEAQELKEQGNKLFGAKKFKEAIGVFTKCIELDASNEVFFSNRSAAYASLEQWEEALEDAKRAVAVKPRWAKAHQRLGAAYMGLRLHSDAKEAYEQAAKLEPDNQAIHSALQRAEMLELQQVQDKQHVFKKRKILQGSAGQDKDRDREGDNDKEKDSKAKQGGKKLLSFEEEEEES